MKQYITDMNNSKNQRAIVMGATSGIGREVAILLAKKGYTVGIAGRRESLLKQLANETTGIVAYRAIDITAPGAPALLMELVDELGGIDLYFHSSGIGYQNVGLDANKENATVGTNALGFTRIADTIFNYFASIGSGHIAIISSIAGTKGLGAAPAYSATKAYQNHYIEALAQLASIRRLKISFTDIRPGFVATDLLNDGKAYPMLMRKQHVARAAVRAIERKQKVAVIDWRYRLLVALWRIIPRSMWIKLPIASPSKRQ